jgi:hypothetical protein
MHVHLLTKNAYENMKAQSAVLNTDHKIARKREKITKLGSDIGHS